MKRAASDWKLKQNKKNCVNVFLYADHICTCKDACFNIYVNVKLKCYYLAWVKQDFVGEATVLFVFVYHVKVFIRPLLF